MRLWLLLLAACGGSETPASDAPSAGDAQPDGSGGLVSLDKTPTTYRETCDGSAALALSFTHFVDLNDENQVARVYERAKPAAPVQSIDLGPASPRRQRRISRMSRGSATACS